jgi:hypothetical protein
VRLATLVTCIVQREGSRWDVTWASDGKSPSDFKDDTLSGALDKASLQIATLYANKPQAAEAELQFAIYAWEGNPGDTILDITSDAGELVAADIQGSGITFRAATPEALVESGERYVPDTSKAMFRWIRRVRDLKT